jgi:hypothetical protein
MGSYKLSECLLVMKQGSTSQGKPNSPDMGGYYDK